MSHRETLSDEDGAPVEFTCGDLVVRLDMEMPGQPDAISPVVELVLALVGDAGCAQGKEFEVETALREALANAVRHGCAHDPSAKVQLCVACDQEQGVLVVVRDPGPGFDPAQVPSPVSGERVYSSHGRGIYLINQLMDNVEYHRSGTEIRMFKK